MSVRYPVINDTCRRIELANENKARIQKLKKDIITANLHVIIPNSEGQEVISPRDRNPQPLTNRNSTNTCFHVHKVGTVRHNRHHVFSWEKGWIIEEKLKTE